MRLRIAMLRSQIAEIGTARMVAVFEKLPRLIRSPGAQIHAQHRFGPYCSTPFDEFIRAESVRLRAEPGQIQSNRSPLDWANTIFPIVARKKIAAGIPNNGRTQIANEIEDVLAEP